MDPNETLRRIRELSRRILDDGPLNDHVNEELAELCEALDEWLSRGGFLPKAWER